ncbi:hypothetical protein [Nocardia aurea]|uniref:hypothetical protein n=1 Tax=Nocardia aurea TaxID=2144174 RepID=UPI0033B8B165
MSDTLIRLWDRAGELLHALDSTVKVEQLGDRRQFTLPIEDPAARYLTSDPPPPFVMATIDEGMSRWSGVIQQWYIRRLGPCPECDHCQQNILVVECYDPPLRWIGGASTSYIFAGGGGGQGGSTAFGTTTAASLGGYPGGGGGAGGSFSGPYEIRLGEEPDDPDAVPARI